MLCTRWAAKEQAELAKRIEQAQHAWTDDTTNYQREEALAAVKQDLLKEYPESLTEHRRRDDDEVTSSPLSGMQTNDSVAVELSKDLVDPQLRPHFLPTKGWASKLLRWVG